MNGRAFASHLASSGSGGMPFIEPAGVCRLFDAHFDRYLREYEDRYEAREGSLVGVLPS